MDDQPQTASKPAPQPQPLTPAQALENLAIIAADYPLRLRERNAINESIALLHGIVKELEARAPSPAPDAAK